MSKYKIRVTKARWIRKPLVGEFTFDDDGDFGGKLWISKKQQIQVTVTPSEEN